VPRPPGGGDEGNRPDSNLPNYGARLRRARLGLICAIATVSMVFVSLTSAYVVRRGLPTFDDSTRSYLRDWGTVELPWLLLAINTGLLLISSLTMEGARRSIARRAALAPVESIPGVFSRRGEKFSLAWGDDCSRIWIFDWAMDGVGRTERAGISGQHQSQQLICLCADGGTCDPPGRRSDCVAVGAGTSLLHRPIEGRRIERKGKIKENIK